MFKSSLLLAALLAASFSEAHLIQGIIDSKENMQFIIVYW